MQGAIQVLGFTFFTSVSYYVLLNVQLKDLKHSLFGTETMHFRSITFEATFDVLYRWHC